MRSDCVFRANGTDKCEALRIGKCHELGCKFYKSEKEYYIDDDGYVEKKGERKWQK